MSGKRQLLRVVGKNARSLSKRYSDTAAEVGAISRCPYRAPSSTPIQRCPVSERNFNDYSLNLPNHIARFDSIPGPRCYPVIGSLWQYLPGGPLYGIPWYDKLASLQNEFGDVVDEEIRPGFHIIHLYNPDDFKEVFRHEGKYPTRESFRMLHRFNEKYNDGIHGLITSNGESWQKKRSVIQGRMSKPKSVRSFLPSQNGVADDFIHLIRHLRMDDDVITDMTPELYKFATESVAVVCFNKRLGTLDRQSEPGSEADIFIDSVNKVFMATQSEMTSMPLYMLYDTPMFKELTKAQRYISGVTMRYAKEAIEMLQKDFNGEDNIPSLLKKSDLSDQEAFTLIGEFFFGGVDTTSHLIGFVLYNLCKNPEKMEILRKEIDRLGRNSGPITGQDLDELVYLKAVLKESLRVTPVAPGNLRTLASDACFSGYDVPAGTTVVLHNEWAGKQERFVPQADQFLPERWIRNKSYKSLNPYIFLPFGFGARSCPGRRLAEQEASLCIIKMLQNFDIEYCHSEDMKYDMQIINRPLTPLSFRFTDRHVSDTDLTPKRASIKSS